MSDQVYAYFPGCSLATSAKENNKALIKLFESLGIQLVELEDWNCCGSSSAHAIDNLMADKLAMRNLSLVPPGTPLLVACPSCNLRLRHARHKLRWDEAAQRSYQQWFGSQADVNLEIVHFFELLDQVDWFRVNKQAHVSLHGLKIAPYYGCMLARPPVMRREKNYHGLMEGILSKLGATPVTWGYASRCCGTFLSVVRPDVVTPMVHEIIDGAANAGAECLVTACSMCQLNLEVRSDGQAQLPIFDISEILALVLGRFQANTDAFLSRHLIDPRPLLQAKHILP